MDHFKQKNHRTGPHGHKLIIWEPYCMEDGGNYINQKFEKIRLNLQTDTSSYFSHKSRSNLELLWMASHPHLTSWRSLASSFGEQILKHSLTRSQLCYQIPSYNYRERPVWWPNMCLESIYKYGWRPRGSMKAFSRENVSQCILDYWRTGNSKQYIFPRN